MREIERFTIETTTGVRHLIAAMQTYTHYQPLDGAAEQLAGPVQYFCLTDPSRYHINVKGDGKFEVVDLRGDDLEAKRV